MIINIRGTSGSGKTTLVRRLMESEAFNTKVAYRVEGRKQPIGYVLDRADGNPSLAVIGHYETVCGGCDTISKMEQIFELVLKAHEAGQDVVFEGLLISADVNRTVALRDAVGVNELLVVSMDKVPVEECLDSVNKRRRAKDPDKPDVNPKNTVSKHKGVKKSLERLRSQDVHVVSCDRNEARQEICLALGITEDLR